MSDEPNKPNDPNSSKDVEVKTSQIELARELSEVLSRVSANLEKISSQTSSQASTMVSMAESFNKIGEVTTAIGKNTSTMVTQLNNVAENFMTSIKSTDITSISKDLEKVGDSVSKGLTSNSKNIEDLKEGVEEITAVHVDINSNLESIHEGLNDDMSKISSEILTFKNNVAGTVPEVGKFSKAMLWFKEKLADLVSAIPSSVKSIIRGGTAIVKGLFNSITSLVGAATQLLKFSITIPFTIAKAAAKIGNTLRTEYVEVIGQAGEDLKEAFDFDSHIGQGVQQMTKRGKGMLIAFQSPSSELVKLFGMGSAGIANMIKEVGNNVNAMGHFSEIFGRSIMGNERRTKNFTKMVRAFGFTSEDIHYMALDASISLDHVNTRMAKLGVTLSNVSTEYGVDRKRLSKNFMILRKDIIQFGHLSDEEIAKTTARLTQMRVKLEDAAAVFKKFSTFEDAANSVAILSQTFGMNLDAFDMIQAKNPEEIIGMFRNSMLETGRSFQDLNRFEKDLMAQHTGMTAESLAALMNYRDLGLTHEEAVKRMASERPEAKQMASLKKLNSAIKEIQKVMTFESPFKSFAAGLAANSTLGGELQDVLVSLSKGYEGIYEYGRTLDPDTWSGLVRPINHIIKIMQGIFKSDAFKNGLVNTVEIISHFIGRVFDFEPHVSALNSGQTTLAGAGHAFSDGLQKNVVDLNSENFNKLVSLSGRIMGSIIKGAAIGFIAIFRTANDGIAQLKVMMDARDPNKNLIESFFGWEPGELVKMGEGLKNAVKDFMKNSSGMISITAWLLDGFTDVFGVIAGIFGGAILAGLDEIFGTTFSKKPKQILKSTALKASRNTSESTMSSVSSSLQKNEEVDKTDLASMIHDLSDKIDTVKDSSSKTSLTTTLEGLKTSFLNEDIDKAGLKDLALKTSTLMGGIQGGEYLGSQDQTSNMIKHSQRKGAKSTTITGAKEYVVLARKFDKLMREKNKGLFGTQLKVNTDLVSSTDTSRGQDLSNNYSDLAFKSFWINFGKELVDSLNRTKVTDRDEHKNIFISEAIEKQMSAYKHPDYQAMKNRMLGKPSVSLSDTKPSAPAPPLTVAQSVQDFEYLNNLKSIITSSDIFNNLMSSVAMPTADVDLDTSAVADVGNTFNSASVVDVPRQKGLSKQKVQETYEKLCLLKEDVEKKNFETTPEFIFDSGIIDTLMKTMAKSNLVRILGMPEYTNGVMNLAESAIGSRCFNVGSDGTAPTTEVIEPSS